MVLSDGILSSGASWLSGKLGGFGNQAGGLLLEQAASKVFGGLSEKLKPEENSPLGRFLEGNPALQQQAEKIAETASDERASIFSALWKTGREAGESWFTRTFPTLDKWLDIGKLIFGKYSEKEILPWQNEIEIFTSLTVFVPDFLLKYMVAPLQNSEMFMWIVEHWPIGNLTEDYDPENPDSFVNILRTMNQDMMTAKVSTEEVYNLAARFTA